MKPLRFHVPQQADHESSGTITFVSLLVKGNFLLSTDFMPGFTALDTPGTGEDTLARSHDVRRGTPAPESRIPGTVHRGS